MHVRTVVADDSPAFRAAASDVLSASGVVDVVAAVASGPEALRAAAEHRPDVMVLDVQMPGGGPELVEALRDQHPRLRMMCLSARDDADTVLRMLAAGATGYVAKGTLDEDLSTCVRRCADGMLFVLAHCADEVRARMAGLVRERAGDPA